MSKILGIICEYNPLHNGHLYHIEESKKIVNPDFTVCIMSGQFTQRGDTALFDKWARAEMALRSGVDLVIELPLIYSISSAENFSRGAINILDSLKGDITLSFGSECGDLKTLENISNVLIKEPPEYTSILKHELSKGVSFPKARENAVLMYLNDIRRYANILSSPNNILGIEYIKALKALKSKINYMTIKRSFVEYNSTKTSEKFASATAIRELITSNKDISKYVPKISYNVIQNRLKYGQFVPSIKSFEKEILYKLRTMELSDIANIADITEGLEFKIQKAAQSCNTLDELTEMIKSKRYTQTRINRILLYLLFSITKQDMENSKKYLPYLRILGTTENGKKLLADVAKSKKAPPLVISVKKFMEENKNKFYQELLKKDILATNIYTLAYEKNSKANLDYTKKLITI